MMKLLRIAVNCIFLWLWFTTAAGADPITIALFGASFAASWGGAIVSDLIGTAIVSAASWGLNQLFGQNTGTASSTTPTTIQFGDRVARNGVFGEVLIAGHFVLHNEYSNSTHFQRVFILSEGWCEGLGDVVYVNNTKCNLIVNSTPSSHEVARYKVDGYDNLIDIRFYDGRPGQLADADLVAENSGWDGTETYAGMAYVIVDCTSDQTKFNGSIPDFQWVFKGLRTYDLRLDSTAGGTGSMRFNDPTTWTYSKNVARCSYHFLRGFWYNSQRQLGVGYSAADVDQALAVAAMNVCDEDVTRPDSTHRYRYEMNLVFTDDQTGADVLNTFCLAMGGFWTEQYGQIALIAGKARSTALVITDVDLIRDEVQTYTPLKSGVSLATGIQGVYTSSTDFKSLAYTAINPSGYIAFNGLENTLSQDFPMVQDAHQAFLLATLMLNLNRKQATAAIVLDIKDTMLEVGDWIEWDSSSALRSDKLYQITQCQVDFWKLRMYLALQEVTADCFGDTAVLDDIIENPLPVLSFDYLLNVAGFSVDPVPILGSGDQVIPGLAFSYSPIADAAVSAVDIQYRIKDGDGTVFTAIDRSPGDGLYTTAASVSAGVLYEARTKLETLPGRLAEWGPWTTASDVTPDFSLPVEVADYSVTLAKLAQDLQSKVGILFGEGAGTLSDKIDSLNNLLAQVVNGMITDQATNKQHVQLIAAQANGASAAVVREEDARVTADQALSDLIDEVTAALGDNLAGGLFQISAEAGIGGADATIAMRVRAAVGAALAQTGVLFLASADGMGGTISQVAFQTDTFLIVDQAGNVAKGIVFDATTGDIIASRLRNAAGTMDINLTGGEETIGG